MLVSQHRSADEGRWSLSEDFLVSCLPWMQLGRATALTLGWDFLPAVISACRRSVPGSCWDTPVQAPSALRGMFRWPCSSPVSSWEEQMCFLFGSLWRVLPIARKQASGTSKCMADRNMPGGMSWSLPPGNNTSWAPARLETPIGADSNVLGMGTCVGTSKQEGESVSAQPRVISKHRVPKWG